MYRYNGSPYRSADRCKDTAAQCIGTEARRMDTASLRKHRRAFVWIRSAAVRIGKTLYRYFGALEGYGGP
jgi:hypothetical protein